MQKNILRTSISCLIFGSISVSLTHNIQAAEITQQVSATGEVQYDSNPLLATSQTGAWRYIATPSYGINIQDGSNTWNVNGLINLQRSSNTNQVANREDPDIRGFWRHEFESGSFGLRAGYNEQSTVINNTIITTGIVTTTDGTRKNAVIGGDLIKDFSDKLKFLVGVDHQEIRYQNTANVPNYNLSNVTPSLVYEYSDIYAPFVDAKYSYYKFDNGSGDYINYKEVGAGVTAKLSEKLTLKLRGAYFSYDGFQSNDDILGGIRVDYAEDKIHSYLDLSRSDDPVGIGGYVLADVLLTGASYNIREKDTVGADLFVRRSRDNTNFQYHEISAYMNHQVTENWQLRLTAAHREVDNAGLKGIGSVVGFSVIYNNLNF